MKDTATILHELAERGLLPLVEEVCWRRHVLQEEICGRSRIVAIVAARRELWNIIHRKFGWSHPMIAKVFDVNTSTVTHALEKDYEQVE